MFARFGLRASVKNMFFDRAAVRQYLNDHDRKSLSRAGAFVRKRGKSLLRRRKRVSAPGEPPSVHSTDSYATLKNILFAWDPSTRSVVVGSVGLNVKSVFGGTLAAGVVPQVMEFGGTLGVIEFQNRRGNWNRADLRSRRRWAGRPLRTRYSHYKPRPYMGRALAMERHNIPRAWATTLSA